MADAQAPPATGIFCWNELMTGDLEAAKTFYSKLFAWKIEKMPMEDFDYVMFKSGDCTVGGLMPTQPGQENPCWLSYVSVDDVDASTKKAESLGAKVCCPPTDIPNNMGRFSIITDPTGAAIGLFQGT